jgi:hypothetical protein
MSDVPGVRPSGSLEPELTLEAKAAVRRYLTAILLPLGVFNLLALGLAVAYLFHRVPTEVTNHTKALVQKDLSTLTGAFTSASIDALGKAISAQTHSESVIDRGKRVDALLAELQKTVDAVSGGNASQIARLVDRIGEMEAVVERGKQLGAQLSDLQIKIESATAGEPGQVLRLLERLNTIDNPRASTPPPQMPALLLRINDDVKELKGRLSGEARPSLNNGFGVGAWKHTKMESRCPPGLIAVGLQVTYGGTCENRCDLDGGTIQDIKLYCR